MADPLTVLRGIQLHYTLLTDSVWSDDDFGHVPSLHSHAADVFRRLFSDAERSAGPSSIGLTITGKRGTGKTHLLGTFRRALKGHGVFVSVPALDAQRFWESVALAYSRSLRRRAGSDTQLQDVLAALGAALEWSPERLSAVLEGDRLERSVRDDIIRDFRLRHPDLGRETHDALRALLLYASGDPGEQDLGDAWLQAIDLGDDLRAEGFRRRYTARETVAMVSALVALVRPQVLTFDQIDLFVSGTDLGADPRATRSLEVLCANLMDLRDVTRRAVTVLSCVLATWTAMDAVALPAFIDRFERVDLRDVQTGDEAQAIVAARLASAYQRASFSPPYATWPVRPGAFASEQSKRRTARSLLKLVEAHIHRCVQRGVVDDLESFVDPDDDTGKIGPDEAALTVVDIAFAEARQAAAVDAFVAQDQEDVRIPALLRAALGALTKEVGAVGERMRVDDDVAASRTALHAILRLGDGETERQRVWSFRALGHTNARAVIARLGAAATAAGIESDTEGRCLVLLRNDPWPSGPRVTELVEKLQRLACRVLPVHEDDLRTFVALQQLLAKPPERFLEWLRSRRPVSTSALFQRVLQWTPIEGAPPVPPSADGGSVTTGPTTPPVAGPVGASLEVVRAADGSVLPLPLGVLAKHTVVFAGSGSGKTVLLRRIVEEAALRGVSSIVLDTNNDLARLGDAWPTPPSGWSATDAQRADEYLTNTEVVVWTPRISAGRPLAFQPLPDFTELRDDPDVLERAISGTVASLAPRALVDGAAQKAVIGRAVLKLAVQRLAARGAEGSTRCCGCSRTFRPMSRPASRRRRPTRLRWRRPSRRLASTTRCSAERATLPTPADC